MNQESLLVAVREVLLQVHLMDLMYSVGGCGGHKLKVFVSIECGLFKSHLRLF